MRLVARLHEKGARTALLVALFVSATALSASAQTLYGSIVGNVRDTSGAAVPGTTVTINEKATGLERTSVSNETGAYSFANVLPGTYNVKVSLQGFKEFVQTDVPVSIGQISRVDVALELGALTETITVASESQLLQTDKAEVSTKLKSADITNMPLNQFRNYQALINLVPGATPAGFQNAETDTPARSLSTNVNGQNRNANATRSDGATNVNIWLPHHVMYVAPAETIDTVNISTNDFDAEQGMAGGAAITVITKSGTNNFKGSGFYFNNNEKLNASPYYFGGLRPEGKPEKPPLNRNIYGGTVGGPIKKNKLFFFGSFEGYKQTSTTNQFFNVPDAALRAGDFRGAVNADGSVQVIYDPATGNPQTGEGRTPFPNNVIPAERLHSISKQLLGLYPMPNNPGFGDGGFSSNYFRPEDRTTDRKNYDFKVNYNRSSAHQIWGKYALLDAVVDDRTYMLGPPTGVEGDGGLTKVNQITAGQTWTFGTNMVWDATFGYSAQKQDVLGPDFESGNYGIDTLHIPGTNDQSDIGGVADARYNGYPRFQLGCTASAPATSCSGGFSDLGNFEGWMPIFRDERTYSFNTNVTKVLGRHDLRAGYMMNFLYLDHWQPELDNPRGRFVAAGAATARSRGPDLQLLQPLRRLPAGPELRGQQERAGRGDDHARVAARAVHSRPVERQRQADARPWPAVGVLPDHAPGRPRARAGGPADARSAARRTWRQRQQRRPQSRVGQLRSSAGRRLSPEREYGPPHRLRGYLQPDSVGAPAARVLPGDYRGQVLHQQSVRLVQHPGRRHPAHHRTGPAERPLPAAGWRRHANA